MSPSRDADSRRGEICRWFEGSARRLGSLDMLLWRYRMSELMSD